MTLNANASTGETAALLIGLRGLVGGIRRKLLLVMAAPADEREHAFTNSKIETLRLQFEFRLCRVPTASKVCKVMEPFRFERTWCRISRDRLEARRVLQDTARNSADWPAIRLSRIDAWMLKSSADRVRRGAACRQR
jgi:hypothetical protein